MHDWQEIVLGFTYHFPPAASDYSAVSQEVMFPAGYTQMSVNISIVENAVLEAMKVFYVEVTVPASHAGVVLLGTDTATISIKDDDSKWSLFSAKYPRLFFHMFCDQFLVSSC